MPYAIKAWSIYMPIGICKSLVLNTWSGQGETFADVNETFAEKFVGKARHLRKVRDICGRTQSGHRKEVEWRQNGDK